MDIPDSLRPIYAIKNETGESLIITSQIFNKDGSPHTGVWSDDLPSGETVHFLRGSNLRPDGCEEVVTISREMKDAR